MTDKEKKIVEAYGDKYETVKKYLVENGWCCASWDFNAIKYGVTPNDIGFKKRIENKTFFSEVKGCIVSAWRPSFLTGIDDNNGWIKLSNSQPKDYIIVTVVYQQGDYQTYTIGHLDKYRKFVDIGNNEIKKVTHWRPLEDYKAPIY